MTTQPLSTFFICRPDFHIRRAADDDANDFADISGTLFVPYGNRKKSGQLEQAGKAKDGANLRKSKPMMSDQNSFFYHYCPVSQVSHHQLFILHLSDLFPIPSTHTLSLTKNVRHPKETPHPPPSTRPPNHRHAKLLLPPLRRLPASRRPNPPPRPLHHHIQNQRPPPSFPRPLPPRNLRRLCFRVGLLQRGDYV